MYLALSLGAYTCFYFIIFLFLFLLFACFLNFVCNTRFITTTLQRLKIKNKKLRTLGTYQINL